MFVSAEAKVVPLLFARRIDYAVLGRTANTADSVAPV